MLPIITIYTSQGCQPCKRLKKLLDDNEIEYIAYDIEEDQNARKFLVEKGFRSVPIIVAGEKTIVGFNPVEVQKLIDQRK